MNSDSVSPEQAAPTRRGHRAWIPIGILLLAAAFIAWVRASTELDGNLKNMKTIFTVPIALLLIVLWYLFLSRLRWRTRLIGFGVFVLLLVGVKASVRFDGSINGSGLPKVVWKWSPKRTGEVTGVAQAASGADVRERPEDSPGYLGRDRTGVFPNERLDHDWSGHAPKELWRHPVGLGWGGIATIGGCAITQEQRGDKESVVCYELNSGKTVWTHTDDVRFVDPMGGDGPRATPTIADGRVYALGATGLLNCLEASTGAKVWSHDTLKEKDLPNTVFGKASSPLICDDLVIIGGGLSKSEPSKSDPSRKSERVVSLLAYHRSDGSPAWESGTDKAAYSSPTVATLAGKRQIVSINATSVTGHDPADGRILWCYSPWGNEMPKCAQPVVLGGDRLLLAASFDAGTVLLQIKPGENGQFSAVEIWKNRNMKSEFSNVVVRDGYIYGLDDGILACLDAATGQRKWKGSHYGHGQVILAGDLLVVQTENGPVALVEASPEAFHEVGTVGALTAKTWNPPALAGDFLLVRNDQEAVCYRLAMAK